MKNKILFRMFLFLVLICFLPSDIISQHVLRNSVFATGGGLMANANNNSKAVVGQTASGSSANANNILHSGFLYAADLLTAIGNDEKGIPTEYNLFQNYPNPFNPSTKIKFALPVAAHVRLEVFNLLGQSIEVLVDEEKSAGYYNAPFN